jgi:COP9 signalosome complex subunit 2
VLWPLFRNSFRTGTTACANCRVQCLKYLVLASMLMESHVDPFNAQETKPYRADPQIQAMTDLVEAYQSSDINKFERVLRASKATVLEDPFIRPYIEDLITVLRTQVRPACSTTRTNFPVLHQHVSA